MVRSSRIEIRHAVTNGLASLLVTGDRRDQIMDGQGLLEGLQVANHGQLGI